MPKTIRSETDALNAISPDTHSGLEGGPWRRILAARQAVTAAEQELRDAVEAARSAGYSWTVIGAALDTTRQAAFQRFGR